MLKHYLRALRPAHSPTRSWQSILAAAALAFAPFSVPIYGAAAAEPSPQTPQREQLTLSTEIKPWTGDLDGMIERRIIRVLTVYSKTFYFVDKGAQQGVTYDIFRLFEEDLNKKMAKGGKLKQKHLKMRVVFFRSLGVTCCRRWLAARAILRRQTSLLPKRAGSWSTFPHPCIATSARWWCPVPLHPQSLVWTSWREKRSSSASPRVIARA